MNKLFVNNGIPISHAVEPKNITSEVVTWLKEEKQKNPDLIGIIQHGYDHNLNFRFPAGMEFGGKRKYRDQFADLKLGYELMEKYFHGLWTPILTFPYGSYNVETLKAVNNIGYKMISSSISFAWKHRLKNLIGRSLKANFLFGKKISYHSQLRPKSSLYEYSISVNIIKKYYNEIDAEHKKIDEILKQIELNKAQSKIIGILLHHRFHTKHLSVISDLIDSLKNRKNINFIKLEDLK